MLKSGTDQKISMACVLACTIHNSREQSAKQKSYKILHVVVDQTLVIHSQGAVMCLISPSPGQILNNFGATSS